MKFTYGRRQSKTINTRLGEQTHHYELQRSVVTKRELSSTVRFSVSNTLLFRSSPMVLTSVDDRKSAVARANGRDTNFAKSSRRKPTQPTAQLWNSLTQDFRVASCPKKRDSFWDISAAWLECPTKDWQNEFCWLHQARRQVLRSRGVNAFLGGQERGLYYMFKTNCYVATWNLGGTKIGEGAMSPNAPPWLRAWVIHMEKRLISPIGITWRDYSSCLAGSHLRWSLQDFQRLLKPRGILRPRSTAPATLLRRNTGLTTISGEKVPLKFCVH